MFSPLFNGGETQLKIHLFLESVAENDVNSPPFQKVAFDNGMQCFEAELECGDDFIRKPILLALTGDDPRNALFLDGLKTLIENKQLPKNIMMEFGDEFPLTFYPHLFCERKELFIEVPSNDRSKTYHELLESIEGNQNPHDYFCAACENREVCFGAQRQAKDNLYVVNTNPTSLFALDYSPFNVLEVSQLSSCRSDDEIKLFLESLADENSPRIRFLEKRCDEIVKAGDASQVILYKLAICQSVLEFVIQQMQLGIELTPVFDYENIYLSHLSVGDSKIALLPVNFTSSTSDKMLSDATARIIQENEQYFVEFRKNLSDDQYLTIDDIISLKFGGFENKDLDCRIIKEENDYYLLEINSSIDVSSIESLFAAFSHEMFNPVQYSMLKGNKQFAEELFFCFLSVLLHNSVLGEGELKHAQKLLFPLFINADNSLKVNDVINHINTNSGLSIVLRQENCYYKPSTEISSKLSNYHWMRILHWMLEVANVEVVKSRLSNSEFISHLQDALEKLSLLVDEINQQIRHQDKSEKEENVIIKEALAEMIEDTSWLEAVLKINKPKQNVNVGTMKQDPEEVQDKTRIIKNTPSLEQIEADNTVMMTKRNENR